MLSSSRRKPNQNQNVKSRNLGCDKKGLNCVNTRVINLNSQPEKNESRIYLDSSKKIVDPINTPLNRNLNEDHMKVLIVPKKGDQKLIIFRLPKDIHGTVQDIITRFKGAFQEDVDSIYSVNDPVNDVRYVVTVIAKPNSEAQEKRQEIPKYSLKDEKYSPTQTIPNVGLSHSHDGEYINGTKIKVDSVSQKPTKTLKRSLQILTIYPSPVCNGSLTITMDDYKCLDENQYLNDVIIDFYLKYLSLEMLSSVDRERILIFNSYFYTRLTHPRRVTVNGCHLSALSDNAVLQHAEVKRWTKDINVFEKDFVIVPIHDNSHWFLTIICYPNQLRNILKHPPSQPTTQNPKPCILIFESIPIFQFKRSVVAQTLTNYLQCEYRVKYDVDCSFSEKDLVVFYPDVPRQTNSSDCGLYLLQYAENFFKDYVIEQEPRSPLKSLKIWFEPNVMKEMRNSLKKLISKLASDSPIFKNPSIGKY